MADRFEDLRNFAAVVDSGGVSAAADALGIAKSAVSRRVADLEARLGVALIDRATRRLTLTAKGREYHRRAKEILASLDELDQDASGTEHAGRRLRLAVDDDLLTRIVIPAVARFLADNENVSVQISIATSTSADDETVGIVISRDAAGQAREHVTVGSTGYRLYGAPSYLAGRGTPATLADLGRYTVITVEDPQKKGGARGSGTVLAVPSTDAALSAAIAGAGLARLPDLAVADAVHRGELVGVDLQREDQSMPIVASFSQGADATVLGLVDHLTKTLRPKA